jgi:hypothetical protein
LNLNPMFAGILSSFKRRLRRFHLHFAVEKEEDGKKNLFHVDVLQAMKWALASWAEISAESIQRSWSIAQVLPGRMADLRISSSTSGDLLMANEDAFIEADILQQMQLLRLPNAVPIEEYLNDENRYIDALHEEFFDVVQVAEQIPDDEVEGEDEDVEEPNGEGNGNNSSSVAPLLSPLTIQEKLQAIRNVIQILKERNENDDHTVSTLRRVQELLRAETRLNLAIGMNMSVNMSMDLNTNSVCNVNNAAGVALGSGDDTDARGSNNMQPASFQTVI